MWTRVVRGADECPRNRNFAEGQLGMNLIDIAERYSSGRSEELVGAAVREGWRNYSVGRGQRHSLHVE